MFISFVIGGIVLGQARRGRNDGDAAGIDPACAQLVRGLSLGAVK